MQEGPLGWRMRAVRKGYEKLVRWRVGSVSGQGAPFSDLTLGAVVDWWGLVFVEEIMEVSHNSHEMHVFMSII